MKIQPMKHPMGTLTVNDKGAPVLVGAAFAPSRSRRPQAKFAYVTLDADGQPTGQVKGDFYRLVMS